MTIDGDIRLWRAGDGYEVWIRRKITGIDRDFSPDDYAGSAPSTASPPPYWCMGRGTRPRRPICCDWLGPRRWSAR